MSQQTTVVFEPFKMVPLRQFHPELRFEYPDLPEQLFDYALLRAARELAHESNALQRRIIVMPYPEVFTYSLKSPDDLEIESILGIYFENQCTQRISVKRTFVAPTTARSCSERMAYYDEQEQCLVVSGMYSAGTYYINCSVTPQDNACSLPAAFYDDWLDLLLLGTKSRILRMNNKPWTNLQLAMLYAKGFADGMAEIAIEGHLHKQRGAIKMNFGRVL